VVLGADRKVLTKLSIYPQELILSLRVPSVVRSVLQTRRLRSDAVSLVEPATGLCRRSSDLHLGQHLRADVDLSSTRSSSLSLTIPHAPAVLPSEAKCLRPCSFGYPSQVRLVAQQLPRRRQPPPVRKPHRLCRFLRPRQALTHLLSMMVLPSVLPRIALRLLGRARRDLAE